MSEQAYKWKITFNTDIRKPAHEVIFSRKSIKANHAPVFFSDIQLLDCQKHFGMHLENKLNFNQHIKTKF